MAARKSSRVHPDHKTKYRITNWRDYEAGLRKRGDLTLWFSQEAIDAWTLEPTGKPGAPSRFSDLVIETALSLRLILHLPLRQTEGFLDSPLRLLELDLTAPDHTTLSRRHKDIKLPPLSPTSSVSEAGEISDGHFGSFDRASAPTSKGSTSGRSCSSYSSRVSPPSLFFIRFFGAKTAPFYNLWFYRLLQNCSAVLVHEPATGSEIGMPEIRAPKARDPRSGGASTGWKAD